MKRKHEGCTHGPGGSWTREPTQYWCKWCDTCDSFRLRAEYYEVYSYEGSWWFECVWCWGETVANSNGVRRGWGHSKSQYHL